MSARGRVATWLARLGVGDRRLTHSCLLININRAYRPNMTVHDHDNATRSASKLGPKREKAQYALSVCGGVVREEYEISAWASGGSTMKARDAHGRADSRSDRFAFVGQIADDAVRDRYLGTSGAHHFTPGVQNPIM